MFCANVSAHAVSGTRSTQPPANILHKKKTLLYRDPLLAKHELGGKASNVSCPTATRHIPRGFWGERTVSKCLLLTPEQAHISSSLTLLRNNAHMHRAHRTGAAAHLGGALACTICPQPGHTIKTERPKEGTGTENWARAGGMRKWPYKSATQLPRVHQ
jgi:hypothetical protein